MIMRRRRCRPVVLVRLRIETTYPRQNLLPLCRRSRQLLIHWIFEIPFGERWWCIAVGRLLVVGLDVHKGCGRGGTSWWSRHRWGKSAVRARVLREFSGGRNVMLLFPSAPKEPAADKKDNEDKTPNNTTSYSTSIRIVASAGLLGGWTRIGRAGDANGCERIARYSRGGWI